MKKTIIPFDLFIKQWQECSLHIDHWDHFGHLRAALYCLMHTTSVYEAILMFRCGSIKYTSSICMDGFCTSRYHETITIFWLQQVHKLIQTKKNKSLNELEEIIKNSNLHDKRFIYTFYSSKILSTPKAKALFIQPDLKKP